jgi:hypothetical protein
MRPWLSRMHSTLTRPPPSPLARKLLAAASTTGGPLNCSEGRKAWMSPSVRGRMERGGRGEACPFHLEEGGKGGGDFLWPSPPRLFVWRRLCDMWQEKSLPLSPFVFKSSLKTGLFVILHIHALLDVSRSHLPLRSRKSSDCCMHS